MRGRETETAMTQKTYQQQIQEMRALREQQERQEFDRTVREQHADAVQRRDAAAASGAWDEFHEADSECEELEKAHVEEFPHDPRRAWWNGCTPKEQEHIRRRWNWVQKVGFDAAANIFNRAAQDAQRVGAKRDSKEYFELADASMEMYLKELDPKWSFDAAGGEEFTPLYIEKIEELLGMPRQEEVTPKANGAIPPPRPAAPPRQTQPQPVRQQPPAAPLRHHAPSAPVSRSAPSLSSGRPTSVLPPLTVLEADIAIASKPRPDMSNEEAIRLYQENKRQLTRDNQMGSGWRGS